MKAAILEKAKKIIVKDIPKPRYSDDTVLVKIKEVGLCGSDIHFYNDGRIGDFIIEKPLILGHESSGIIEEVGKNVKNINIGDRVTIEPGVPCYKCYYCKTGRYNLCKDIQFMAVPHCDGAFREYIEYDPNFLFKISDHVSYTEGALAEPLSVAYFAVSKTGLRPIDTVCILGAGPIGLAILEMCKIAGTSKIFISDINDFRLSIAKQHQATFIINPLKEDIINVVYDNTNGEGVDIAIEAAGVEQTIFQSLKIVRSGGKVVWVSVGKEKITIPYQEVIFREIAIEGINRYANSYEPVVKLLEEKRFDFESYITRRYKLDDIEEAFRFANNPKEKKVKIIIEID